MKMQIFSIYDMVAKVFSQPIFAANKEVMARNVAIWLQDEKSYISQSPSDYSLYHIGEYDDENALLVPVLPSVVVRCDSLSLKGPLK